MTLSPCSKTPCRKSPISVIKLQNFANPKYCLVLNPISRLMLPKKNQQKNIDPNLLIRIRSARGVNVVQGLWYTWVSIRS